MSATAEELITPEVEQWIQLIAPRIAAKLDPKRTWTLEEVKRAIGNHDVKAAHGELQDLIMEMALGETERSKLARTALMKNIYDSLT